MTADEHLHKFDVFRNSDVRTDRGRPLPFGRSVMPVELIFFQQPVHACPCPILPRNSLNKRRGLQFSLTLAYALISA